MSSYNDQLNSLLTGERWPEAVSLLQSMPLSSAKELFSSLPDERQQMLFRLCPIPLASKLLSGFPYYHQYILLHARPASEINQVLDQMDPDERMQFLDELPEEAWQHLVEGTDKPAEEPPAPKKPAARISEKRALVEATQPAKPIIEARAVEKHFVQPDGETVQIIAPLDLQVYPGAIIALLG